MFLRAKVKAKIKEFSGFEKDLIYLVNTLENKEAREVIDCKIQELKRIIEVLKSLL